MTKLAETRMGFPLFSLDSDDRLSLNFHRFVILYVSCDTRSVGLWTILFTDVQFIITFISILNCTNQIAEDNTVEA